MRSLTCVVLFFTVFSLVVVSPAQQPSTTAVPNFINYSGTLVLSSGVAAPAKTFGVTFAIYRREDGGAPIWLETQNVTPDSAGHYRVLLGSTRAEGIPADLFNTKEQRWLGVQMQGEAEQPRVLLVSVPYAMKAADAETVGGLPASAFVRANPQEGAALGNGVNAVATAAAAGSGSNAQHGTVPAPTVYTALQIANPPAGKTGYFPYFTPITGHLALVGNSGLFQSNAGNLGVNTATPAFTLDVNGAINSATGYDLQGVAFVFGSPFTGNSFLGFAGNSTTTGNTNSAVGYWALKSNTTGNGNAANGAFALQRNDKGAGNSATGVSALTLNTSGNNNTATGNQALVNNTTASDNTATGTFALALNTVGYQNTASGRSALIKNTRGFQNTSDGAHALNFNTTGNNNTAIGADAMGTNVTGSSNTALGMKADVSVDGLTNATAVGANAEVGASNSLVLGSINGVNGATADANVGIGDTAPAAKLTVSGKESAANGFGAAIKLANTALSGGNWYFRAGATGTNTPAAGFTIANDRAYMMTITTDGKFGLGSLVPTQSLQIDGGNELIRGPNNFHTGGDTATLFLGDTNNFIQSQFSFGISVSAFNATKAFNILNGGNVGIGTTAPDSTLTVNGSADKPGGGSWGTFSDRRLKTLNGNFTSGLEQILKLKPVRYRYNDDNALGIHDPQEHVGLVAQEVQRVIPEAVTENSKGYLLVNNDPILWSMLNAIKEQQGQIREQKEQIRKQQEQIQAQQAEIRAEQVRSKLEQAQIARLSSQIKVIQTSLSGNGRTSSEIRPVKAIMSVAKQ